MASILPEILKLAAVPGMGAACQAVLVLYTVAENVKIHKQRCKHLRSQCIETLLALKDHGKALGDSSSTMKMAIDEFESKVLKIHSRMEAWTRMSMLASIIRKDEISIGLDEFYKDLQLSSSQFQIAGAVEISRQQQEQRLLYERDHAELREQLLKVVRQHDALSSLVESEDTNDVTRLMQTIQEEIQQPDDPNDNASSIDRQQLETTLWKLQKEADVLPPMIDLTSEVKRISEFPVAHGGDSDVYIGEWLGQEKVALKFTRGFNHSDTAKKKFYYEVSIWRGLQHENIVRLYGVANFGGAIYTVSPWMENGDAARYLAQHPDADGRKLIYEVAQGLNYLHCHGVAHGDLRCINILITRYGVACISDFGLSILISDIEESIGRDPSTRDTNLGSLRWRAPELIEYPEGSRPVVTPFTDVWSYGMLCLEVMTGQRPYHALQNDMAVLRAITSGKVPSPPSSSVRELDGKLWKLMNSCWQMTPENRPSMSQIVHQLKPTVSTVTGGPITGSPRSMIQGTLPEDDLSVVEEYSDHSPYSNQPRVAETRHRQRTGTVNSTSTSGSDRQHYGSIRSQKISTTEATLPRENYWPPVDGAERQRSGTSNIISSPRSERLPIPPPAPVGPRPNSSGANLLPPGVSWPASRGMPIPKDRYSPPSSSRSTSSLGSFNSPVRAPASSQPARYTSTDTSTQPTRYMSTDSNTPRPTRSGSQSAPFDRFPPPIHVAYPSASSSLHESLSEELSYLNFGEPSPTEPLNGAQPTYHRSSLESMGSIDDQFDLASQDVPKVSSTGEVLAGSISALLRRLLVPTDTPELDIQFRDTFLTCYTAFSGADQVFKALQKRYRSAEQTNLSHSVDTQNGILTILRIWLGEHRVYPKDVELLQAMKRFAQTIGGPTTISHSGLLLQSAITKRETELSKGIHIQDRAHSTRVYAGFKASAAHPRDFAIGLTVWAWDLYSDLLKSDFVSWLAKQPGQQFVENHLTLKSKLDLWARKMIVDSPKEDVRTARLTLFISVAQECRKLRNYLCMAALTSACNNWAIVQMKHTYGDLKKEAKDALSQMAAIMEPRDNFQRYRDELSSDSRSNRPLIPDIAIHANDVQRLWENKMPTTLFNGREMINFTRYTTVTQEIKRILSFQQHPVDLERYRDAGALAYLENTLSNLEVTTGLEHQLRERSEQLIASEKLAYENRVRELRDAGFGRPRRSSKK